MLKVVLGNSMCRIEGYSPKQFSDLRELLSYHIDSQQAFYAGAYRSSKRYLLDRKGVFPTGLLYIVQKYLGDTNSQHTVIDNRKRPEARHGLFSLSLGYPPYPEQEEIAEAGKRLERGTISAPTGFGKSIAIAVLINKLQLKTLIVVPNLELKRQLKETLSALFGSLNSITVENIDSGSLKSATDYDCLIIDEAHHVAASTYRKLNRTAWKGIYYRFFFTATPFRSRDEEQLLFESVAGQVIYRVDYKTAVDRGYVVPMEAYFYDLPKVESDGHKWSQVYSSLVVNRKDRNGLIAHLMGSLHWQGINALCLVKEIKHGNLLSDLSGAAFANGKGDDCQDLISWFNEGKLKCLIGTTGVVGEGVDTKPAEFVIIAGLGKSKNAFMQQVGRGFRRYPGKESCKIILFRDPSHKWTKAHFKAQVKYLREEYGVKPVKLPWPKELVA
jgi:superfamily II DNA or RNA helicase